ncbi:hypothetical protein Tco_0226108 [Tanacetum coccineum]
MSNAHPKRQEPKSICWRFLGADSGEDDDEKICLGVDLEPDEWIKDSGCSKHMMGNQKLFSTYKAYNGGNVIFGSNLRGNIIGKGQICDNKCRVTFFEHDSEITKDGKVIGACVFTDRWRLDELAYGIPSDGPYQTNFLLLRIFRLLGMIEIGKVCRIRHEEEIDQKPRRDRGTRRGRHSTSSSSSAFNQPSSSHLNDDDDDGNDEGTSRASTPSLIRYVNSLTNQVPQVFQNPPNIDPDLEPFYTHQIEIINRKVQLRDEHRGGVRDCIMVMKEIVSRLLEEVEKLEWWFEQDIDDEEEEEDEEGEGGSEV